MNAKELIQNRLTNYIEDAIDQTRIEDAFVDVMDSLDIDERIDEALRELISGIVDVYFDDALESAIEGVL